MTLQNSFWKSRLKKCVHFIESIPELACKLSFFFCSSLVFSSSSDSSSSNVSVALFLVLDAVAWGSSEMQNSTIVSSMTNQKSYFHMQRSLNKFIDLTFYVGCMVCLSQHYRLKILILFSCPTIAVWWCFLALICIFTLLYLILGFGISVSGTFFLFAVHPLYFHPYPTPPLHKTCIFLAFQPIWHFFWCQMSWPGAHLKCKIQLLLEVLQTKKVVFTCK